MSEHRIVVERGIKIAGERVEPDLEVEYQEEGIVLLEAFPGGRVGVGHCGKQTCYGEDGKGVEVHLTGSKQEKQ